MKTEENMHCNFCADGIYDKTNETTEIMVRGKNITHTLYKCDSCEGEIMRGEIMRGEKMNRCHHCGQEFCEKGNSDEICNKCKDSIIAGVEKEYGMRPQSLTGPVLSQSLNDYISKGTIIRTFDSEGNRLVIGLLSKRPYAKKGFIDDDSKVESNFSRQIARIGSISGAAIVMVSDRVHEEDLKGELE